MNKEWSSEFKKIVRISEKNLQRLKLTRGTGTVAKQLDVILNAYFENGGGEKERKRLKKNIKLI